MRILFLGGGSVGHLAPLVAVWRELKKQEPEAEAIFLCSEQESDGRYLAKEKVEYRSVPAPRRARELITGFPTFYRSAARVIDAFKPDVVLSKGGAVSVPACLAAKRRNIPFVLHDSDAVMGRANRFLSRWAKVVCLGFPPSNQKNTSALGTWHLALGTSVTTGNPIRPEITRGSRQAGLTLTGFSGHRPVLLIWGGSQGAEALNAWARDHVDALVAICDVAHVMGPGKQGAAARPGYWSTEMAYENLPHLHAITSLAISRAGAGSISELAANAIPMILVPLRGLAQDHQLKNAVAATRTGGAIRVEQEEMNVRLLPLVSEILQTSAKRDEMSRGAQQLAQPEAAGHVARILLQCIA
jgi:UDP-N-acetylglucosamine--N-acetylmuramyl-(pentapeptide) pyrophosphoryl-undecaprenol N-acetylglucosamine transferase